MFKNFIQLIQTDGDRKTDGERGQKRRMQERGRWKKERKKGEGEIQTQNKQERGEKRGEREPK